jgi:hypothetical protein
MNIPAWIIAHSKPDGTAATLKAIANGHKIALA